MDAAAYFFAGKGRKKASQAPCVPTVRSGKAGSMGTLDKRRDSVYL